MHRNKNYTHRSQDIHCGSAGLRAPCIPKKRLWWCALTQSLLLQGATPKNSMVRWTLDFGMDSQEVFGGFGRKGSRLRCFVVKLIWPSWNCGQFDGMLRRNRIRVDFHGD